MIFIISISCCLQASTLTAEVRLHIVMGPTRFSWQNPPVVDVTVAVSSVLWPTSFACP